jgi:hypothetical protein
MDEMTNAQPSEGEAISVEQAVALMQTPEKRRDERGRFASAQENNEPATSEESGAAEESGDEPDAAQPEEAATSEDAGNDPAEQPPLDLPRSWSKDRAEQWNRLDRETQEYLLDHDRTTSAEVRRAQNEAAERAKAIEAERQAYEQARQQYETQLPILLSSLQNQAAAEFQDITTWADVAAMQANDPIRYQRWDLYQKQAAAIQQEIQAAQTRQQQEEQEGRQRFIAEETQRLYEVAPEFADPKQQPKLVSQIRELLTDKKFSEEEVRAVGQGAPISFYDHRVQLILRDAMRYRASQQALKNAPAKPAPQVQRPGTALGKGEVRSSQVQALETKLSKTHSVDDAVALLRARRRA